MSVNKGQALGLGAANLGKLLRPNLCCPACVLIRELLMQGKVIAAHAGRRVQFGPMGSDGAGTLTRRFDYLSFRVNVLVHFNVTVLILPRRGFLPTARHSGVHL
jgi:hypothetical protein